MKDFYYILATDVNCTSIEIKEAYEKLSEKLHPDLNQNDKYFENKFREITEAYEVLIDPVKRSKYDQEFKKAKSYALINKPKKQRSHTRAIDIAFTLILISITFIFGNYVIKSISTPKAVKIKKTPGFGTIPLIQNSSHPKKHNSKIRTNSFYPKTTSDTSRIRIEAQTDITDHHINLVDNNSNKDNSNANNDKRINSAGIENKTNIDNNTGSNNSNNIAASWYATYIKSNETGVINMRKLDNYSSDVIKVIPTNSEVFVLEKGSIYYKVQFDNSIGYVPKWTLQKK